MAKTIDQQDAEMVMGIAKVATIIVSLVLFIFAIAVPFVLLQADPPLSKSTFFLSVVNYASPPLALSVILPIVYIVASKLNAIDQRRTD